MVQNKVNQIIYLEIILLKLCFYQNDFEFNNKIYINDQGLIMGNPLSSLLTEICMDDIEKTIYNHSLSTNFIYWYRYVDEILETFNPS